MAVPAKVIQLDDQCCPKKNPTPIGKLGRDIVWTRTDGTKVVRVTIDDPDGFFDQGKQVGDNYVIHYNGSQPPFKSWSYKTHCAGGTTCSADLTANTPPQMNNDPG